MQMKSVTVELKSGDKIIATVELVSGGEPVFVGRSHTCALRTPREDFSVSGRHAKLYLKGGAVWIEDAESRNGVYQGSRRITKAQKMKPGEVFGIGNCRVYIPDRAKVRSKDEFRYHRLEFLNGDRAHQLVEIKGKGDKPFTIGLDPDNDIPISDMIVSRRHAALTVRANGECWIRDLESRNGTYVNGEALKNKERLLKDGDKISIAYFDFKFLDRAVSHSRANLMAKLGALSVVGIVLATAYVIWHESRPDTEHFRKEARLACAREAFDEALSQLESAKTARDYINLKLPVAEDADQIRRWKDTFLCWAAVQDNFRKGQLATVRMQLPELVKDKTRWQWNDTSAPVKYRDAVFANEVIRLCSDAEDALKAATPEIDAQKTVVARIEQIDGFMKKNAKAFASANYLAGLTNRLQSLKTGLVTVREGMAQVDAALAGIDRGNPDFALAASVLDTLERDERQSYAVRSYARALLPVCKGFVETRKFLDDERVLISGLDFAAVNARKATLPLPDKDACAKLSVFSDARDVFIRLHGDCQKEAGLLAPMVRNLESVGVRVGATGSKLDFVVNTATWDKALTFDCFTGRFPFPSREDPNGTYDDLVGIEYTYEMMKQLPKPPGRQMSVRMNFVPKCQIAKATFEQVKTFKLCLERPEALPFRKDRLGSLYELSAKILLKRDGLVGVLRKRAGDAAKPARERAVAGFYAEYFAEEQSYADLRALEATFKDLEHEIAVLDEKYELESDPEKRLAIKKEVLAKGMPGNPLVRKRWVEMVE